MKTMITFFLLMISLNSIAAERKDGGGIFGRAEYGKTGHFMIEGHGVHDCSRAQAERDGAAKCKANFNAHRNTGIFLNLLDYKRRPENPNEQLSTRSGMWSFLDVVDQKGRCEYSAEYQCKITYVPKGVDLFRGTWRGKAKMEGDDTVYIFDLTLGRSGFYEMAMTFQNHSNTFPKMSGKWNVPSEANSEGEWTAWLEADLPIHKLGDEEKDVFSFSYKYGPGIKMPGAWARHGTVCGDVPYMCHVADIDWELVKE